MRIRFESLPVFTPTLRNVLAFEPDIHSLLTTILGGPGATTVRWAPAMSITETPTESKVTIELPGVLKEDIHIAVENGLLTVSGERKPRTLPEASRWLRTESVTGRFERTVKIHHDVKSDGISAELTDGVLHITLPKTEAARPRAIAIQ